jgi:NAD(P)-dependent dehydrogenase (short-subunit alcohol dehydrogenase family)
MGTAAVSGSASGIGAAVRSRLERQGDRIIGIDVRDAEIEIDLSDRRGREAAIARVEEHCEGRLDRLVLSAGLGVHVTPISQIASVNYFGAVELLDGLLPALKRGEDPAAVVICSNSAQFIPLEDHPYTAALLAHDEAGAHRILEESGEPFLAYAGSKNALGRALRRRAGEWGRAGVRLNAVAPGPVETPLLEGGLGDPRFGEAIRSLQVPLGRRGEPDDVAGLVSFLLGPDASWIHGSIYYIDGGNDAEVRPDRF